MTIRITITVSGGLVITKRRFSDLHVGGKKEKLQNVYHMYRSVMYTSCTCPLNVNLQTFSLVESIIFFSYFLVLCL